MGCGISQPLPDYKLPSKHQKHPTRGATSSQHKQNGGMQENQKQNKTSNNSGQSKVQATDTRGTNGGNKSRDYVDIYGETPGGSTCQLEGEDVTTCDVTSLAGSRSLLTSRTLLTLNMSVATRRTKSTYLDHDLSRTFHDQSYDRTMLHSPAAGEDDAQEDAASQEVVPRLPVRPLVVYEGNYFWWPNKRMLLSDYSRVCQLDAMAAKVGMCNDVAEIVRKLTSLCEDDVEVARAVFSWIVAHIRYKPGGSLPDNAPILEVLEQGLGSSHNISHLYRDMCQLAGVECEVVRGLVKSDPTAPAPAHVAEPDLDLGMRQVESWNKIRLASRWYLVDASTGRYTCDSEDHQDSFPDEFFLPKPHDFLSTHLPLHLHPSPQSNDTAPHLVADVENQLVMDDVVMDVTSWERHVLKTTAAHEWGLKALSHPHGEIETNQNEMWIQIMSPHVMDYHAELFAEDKGIKREGFTLIYIQEEIITCYLRLPGPGRYIVKVYATPTYTQHTAGAAHHGSGGLGCKLVFMYKVHAVGRMNYGPFSTRLSGLWGITPVLYNTGCRVVNYKGAELTAVDGRVSVDLRLPTPGLIPSRVWFCRNTQEDVNLEGYIYPERVGRGVHIHLTCPHKGEYILQCMFPVQLIIINDSVRCSEAQVGAGEEVWGTVRFFITCPDVGCPGVLTFPHLPPSLCGPQPSMVRYGLSLPTLRSSTLYTSHGVCQFDLHQERHVKVTHDLEGVGGVVPRDAARWISAQRNGHTVTYIIKIHQSGHYKLTLRCEEAGLAQEGAGFTKEEAGLTQEVVCVLLIDSSESYHGDLYPAHCGVWGVTPLFHHLGLCSDQEEVSQLEVVKGHACFTVRVPAGVTLTPRLYHGNDVTMDLTDYRITSRRDVEVTVHVMLPFRGFYKLEILIKGRLTAVYLLHCDRPRMPLVPYEAFTGEYGTQPGFVWYGLEEVGEGRGEAVRKGRGGACVITHLVPDGLSLRFILLHQGIRQKGCVYAERSYNQVHYHIALQNKGYHRFTGWLLPDQGEGQREGEQEPGKQWNGGKEQGEQEQGKQVKGEKLQGEQEKETMLFSYLIYNHDGIISTESYPESSGIWGINRIGLRYGAKLRGRCSSTLTARRGVATLSLTHPDDLHVTYILQGHALDLHDAERSLFVEHQSDTDRFVSLSLPAAGRFILNMHARRPTEKHSVVIGAFLVTSDQAGTRSYPTYNDFYPKCKLLEPKINPLTSNHEYFFKLLVPGARRIQLWDGVGRWTALLGSPETGSDVISGLVNVGQCKELWVAGLYEPDHPHGNGGFRNLLMYDVIRS